MIAGVFLSNKKVSTINAISAFSKLLLSEIKAFKEKINVPDNEIKNVARLWDQAKKTTDGFEVYAKQISDLLGRNSSVLEELLNLLITIAQADGKITIPEIKYLKKVGDIFGFSNADFERIYSSKSGVYTDPYQVLGVSRNATVQEIKRKWKQLAINHHPDRLISQGVPEDLIQKSTSRLKEINNAWDTIQKQR